MTKKIVMIVEDNPDQLEWLTAVFKPDFTVLPARTGIDAQQLFDQYQHEIDALILDIRLPDMTAFELLNSFEKMCFPGIPPIVIQTEYDDQSWMQEMFGDYRTLNYLVKPFDQQEIIDAVQNAINANPFSYKGAQIEERMAVMSALNTIRLLMYHHVTQMPTDRQHQWMPEILDLFRVDGMQPEDRFPSGAKETFKLTASLAPIFDLIHRMYRTPIPEMEPFRLGVTSALASSVTTAIARNNSEITGVNVPQFEIIEVNNPSHTDLLDFWVSDLNTENMGRWEDATKLFQPYLDTSPVCGIAIIQPNKNELLREAVLLGIPRVTVKTDNFQTSFYALLMKSAIRQYELKSLQKLSSIIRNHGSELH